MFKVILDASLAARGLVLALAAALLLWGGWLAGRTPVDVFPDLNKPTVTLMTEAGGMAPEEVEQLIAVPLEAAMGGLPGVESVRSTAAAGLAVVTVTFGWDADLYRARQFVAERLATVEGSLPPGVVPRMGPVSSIMGEILLVAVPTTAAPGVDPEAAAMAAREAADWVLRPRLLAVPGVAQVIPIGGGVRQFQVRPDARRMAALGVTVEDLRAALQGFAANLGGGFLQAEGRELLIRHLARTVQLEDLRNVAVRVNGQGATAQPILLHQVAEVGFGAAPRRGDAGLDGGPAVVLSVQKQPAADTVKLTRAVEAALQDAARSLPPGVAAPRITFRQADFIEASLGNLKTKLMAAAGVVAVVVWAFLGSVRLTLVSLAALPLSLLAAVLVFRAFDISINTMTLGGLAIAIGELVDDAIVDLENIVRRLRENAALASPRPALTVVRDASQEVRGGVIWSTVVVLLVFLPLLWLPGIEGRLFVPLGIAYMAAIAASLGVAVTVTPVLAWFLVGRRPVAHHEARLARWLKSHYAPLLRRALAAPWAPLALAAALVLVAVALVPTFPRSFLPPFNEGSLVIGLRLNPGSTLAQSTAIGREAERLLQGVPEVTHVGRRSGRAELDEHAEGVHVTELDVGLQRSARSLDAVQADVRNRLATLPVAVSLGQPISHRLDHLLSGVRAQIAVRLIGEDLDLLRGEAARLRDRLGAIRGLADLEVEKLVLSPQLRVRLDLPALAQHGLSPALLARELQALTEGERVSQVVEGASGGARRFDVVLRLPESARGPEGLQGLLVETPLGRVPLSRLAAIEEGLGPNQISRDDGRRRIVLSANVANAQGRPLSAVVEEVRQVVAAAPLPAGVSVSIGGQFQAQEEASRLIALLGTGSALLVFLVLQQRYRSSVLALLVMANIPLALVGSVLALKLAGQPLSIAALIGFVTLAGIATRNGLLKTSHWVNLMRLENMPFGTELIVRGSAERLVPVLMTALTAALALSPLLLEAEQPGTELLHPVAVVIFGGLVGATLLDAFVTPLLFARFGRRAAERLAAAAADGVPATAIQAL
ncbi:efflux RND transporter permease subunit [Aquabacterium sp. J223]|uniref:efflux RND transporter permease subunit n=1 Tax=Aquabacterium sp. J223 TaxID=2898431 RepID=UPI0021AE185B|nr:efflux RND transporter permease subunit [Aquabacterium sp. J223]UUX94255.1 efflux RND transporter permease subunit [Aquabacterium sp. J223]